MTIISLQETDPRHCLVLKSKPYSFVNCEQTSNIFCRPSRVGDIRVHLLHTQEYQLTNVAVLLSSKLSKQMLKSEGDETLPSLMPLLTVINSDHFLSILHTYSLLRIPHRSSLLTSTGASTSNDLFRSIYSMLNELVN